MDIRTALVLFFGARFPLYRAVLEQLHLLASYRGSYIRGRAIRAWVRGYYTYLVKFKKFHAFFLRAISPHRTHVDEAISELYECTSVKYRPDTECYGQSLHEMLRKTRQQQQHNRKAKQHNTTRPKQSFLRKIGCLRLDPQSPVLC